MAKEDVSPGAPTWWAVLRDNYFVFDRRTLGFARLIIGFLMLTDLFRRQEAWAEMFSDEGVLPNHVNLFRPWDWQGFSIVNAFSTRGECWALFVVILATYVCLFVGYKTKLAQVLTLLWITSMNMRVLMIENGGYVVNNLLALWTCFLPLGDRFSVDAMLKSMRTRRETSAAELNARADLVPRAMLDPYVSLLGPVICIQLAAIYFFNVIHKTGPAWHNGTAVHFVVFIDRMVTPYIALVRDYVPSWGYYFMTKSTIALESSLPFAVLLPGLPIVPFLTRVWLRRATIVMINCLHIAFGTVFVLGPFAWSVCAFSTLLFSKEDWEIATRTMRREHRARTIVFNPSSGAALFACRILARLDRYELLTFEEGDVVGLEVLGSLSRSAALAEILAALPLGPTVAWPLRLPGVRSLVDAIVAAAERRNLSRFFGLHVNASSPLASAAVSPIRRRFGRAGFVLNQLLVLLMFAAAVNQAMVELWVINRRIKVKQPEPLLSLAHKTHFLQGWFMFSPNPQMDDGTLIVDALTIDGRHVDPFWGKEPNFDLLHAKSFGYDQIWSDYFNRIRDNGHTFYREAMKEYLYRLPERTGNPNDEIVSGDVYWIQDMNPKWGEINSWKEERNKLFSFENPKHTSAAAR